MSANEDLWSLLGKKLSDIAKAADVLQLEDIVSFFECPSSGSINADFRCVAQPAFVDAALHTESMDDRELLVSIPMRLTRFSPFFLSYLSLCSSNVPS